jgi:hypothetical protein
MFGDLHQTVNRTTFLRLHPRGAGCAATIPCNANSGTSTFARNLSNSIAAPANGTAINGQHEPRSVSDVVGLRVLAIVGFVLALALQIQDYAVREYFQWEKHPSPETYTAFLEKQQQERAIRLLSAIFRGNGPNTPI